MGTPNAHYSGRLLVGNQEVDISDWIGSQNHNWGKRHTDHYAWGQVAGFDNNPDAFLELSTDRVRSGCANDGLKAHLLGNLHQVRVVFNQVAVIIILGYRLFQ